jgi:hypothetical protein
MRRPQPSPAQTIRTLSLVSSKSLARKILPQFGQGRPPISRAVVALLGSTAEDMRGTTGGLFLVAGVLYADTADSFCWEKNRSR